MNCFNFNRIHGMNYQHPPASTQNDNQASLPQLFSMGSISSPPQSGPPLETLSVKQLLRLHCREKLFVHPLEWTSRHVEVLQCSFEESPPPPPSQEHLDEVDKLLATSKKVPTSVKLLLLSDDYGWRRESLFRRIIGSEGCPLQPYGTSIELYFDGRCVSSLPCQPFTSSYSNKAAFEKGTAPIVLVNIDCDVLESLRKEKMRPHIGRRWSPQTDGIYFHHVKRVTPPNRLRDPYLVALLLAIAYNQRRWTASSIWTRESFWPQVVMTKEMDEYVHLFAAHISSNYLNKFDFPSRRPAKSAQQPLVIHHIPLQIKPYDTFRHRLLTILLHPADYYKEGRPTD